MLPSAQCDCGHPWEVHELRCPGPKHRGAGRVVALALAGGVAVQVLFVAAVFAAGVISPPPLTLGGPVLYHAGPVQPRVQACELFYAWEKTHNPGLLNRAVDDAHSWRVPWQFKPRFRTDLTGLRNSTRRSAHSPKAISFEHAVQSECHAARGMNPRFRAKFLKPIAQFSRPSTANVRSAGTLWATPLSALKVPESGQSWNAPSMTH